MNYETRTVHFTVYPDAAQIGDEEFTGDAGATRSELTGWISVQHRVLTLAPGASEMDRAVDLDGSARLTHGPGNTSAGPFPAQKIITLAPGQAGNMSFAPPKSLPDGSWQAKVTLVSGITTSTATATVQFGALAASGTRLGLMAWAGIALGGVALSGGLAAILVRRRALRCRRALA
jgi:hypothetical protein